MNNLILIGMPGSGKTTVGKPLAETLGYSFRDSDGDILEETNNDVAHWLEGLGDTDFLAFEARKIRYYYEDMTNTVLSTGGSVALVPESVEFLKQRGKLILLDTPIESILEREGSMRIDRIVGMNGENPPFKDLRELFEFRKATYEAACNIRVDTHNRPIQTIIADIRQQLSL